MRRALYDHRRALFAGLFLLTPGLFVAAFRWQDALRGFAAVLAALLALKAASVAVAVGVRTLS